MSAAVRLISHRVEIVQRAQQAFAKTALAYNDQMRQVITQARQWPIGFGVTDRRNGERVVGSYRNIVDIGNLANSQSVDVTGFQAIYSWDGQGETPPIIVHEGATLANGHRIPARRWTAVAAQEMNFGETFRQAWNDGRVNS